MSFIYKQSTGDTWHLGAWLGISYSGRGEGKNNPDQQAVHDVGPIPQGEYGIGDPHDSPTLGRHVMVLIAKPSTETFGRHGFFWHGDNKTHDASHGCIVSSRLIRDYVSASGDRDLMVIA